MFTDKDLIQIKAHGLTPQGVEKQMENFRRGTVSVTDMNTAQTEKD